MKSILLCFHFLNVKLVMQLCCDCIKEIYYELIQYLYRKLMMSYGRQHEEHEEEMHSFTYFLNHYYIIYFCVMLMVYY